jgi:hypothetical protein
MIEKSYFSSGIENEKSIIIDFIKNEGKSREKDTLTIIEGYKRIVAKLALSCLDFAKNDN